MRRPLSAYVRAVAATYRSSPAELLPAYLLGAAVPVIARVFVIVGVAVAYLHLWTSGRLATASDRLAAVDTEPPDPEADPELAAEWLTNVTNALEPLATPTVGVVLAAALVLLIIGSICLSAVVGAAQLGACRARLRAERGTIGAIAAARRHWVTFLGLSLLEFALWTATAGVVAAVALVVGVGAAAPEAALLVGLLGLLAWIPFVAAIRAVFAFAVVAAVVDDTGVVGALSGSIGFLRRRPVGAIFYFVLALAGLVGLSSLTSVLAVFGAPAAGSLVILFGVLPALGLLKTVLYGDYRDAVRPPASPERALRSQFVGGLRRGWRELWGFVRETPGAHALATATMLVGFAMGWLAADPFVGATEASIAGRLEGHVAPVAALHFFTNNWTVALTTAYAGVAAALPAVASLWFNGAFFGVYGRLEADPVELLAFVAPHGIVEIPAILVAGALGIALGATWWRTWRGRRTRADLADALERAFWVLVGLGLLLLVAGLIEGFVSPYYYRPFL